MPTYISLLRGINVGGNKIIKMAALKALYETLGMTKVQTLLQSGNVIFEADSTDPASVTDQLETAIEAHFGFQSRIAIRTPEQLSDTLQQMPFSVAQLAEPDKVALTFLMSIPTEENAALLMEKHAGNEEMYLHDQTLYVYYPDGMGRSKLSNVFIEKHLKVFGTARNLNTANKLLKLTLPSN